MYYSGICMKGCNSSPLSWRRHTCNSRHGHPGKTPIGWSSTSSNVGHTVVSDFSICRIIECSDISKYRTFDIVSNAFCPPSPISLVHPGTFGADTLVLILNGNKSTYIPGTDDRNRTDGIRFFFLSGTVSNSILVRKYRLLQKKTNKHCN